MKDHDHHWDKQPFTSLVERGTCFCGAVKFFPLSGATTAINQAELYNQKYGKPGRSHYISAPAKNIDTIEKKEENDMGAENPEGPEKEKRMHIPAPNLAPVPARPDTSGKNKFQRNSDIHNYYEEHAVAILADRERIGDKPAKKRWGFSYFGWRSFKEHHGIPVPKVVHRKPKTAAPKPEPDSETEPEQEAVPEAKVYPYGCLYCPAKFAKEDDLWKHIKLHFKPIMPEFPAFDKKWKKEVQVEWLRAYEMLASGREM